MQSSRAVRLGFIFGLVSAALAWLLLVPAAARAGQNQVMGEVQFSSTTKAGRESGVWVDGQYVGYLKELKGDKKITLLPGEHDISVRQVGYKEFTKHMVIEPGQVQSLEVSMEKDTKAEYPGADASILKIHVMPERAAIFVDDGYAGHGSDFGGIHSMLLSPGTHTVKIELPGYRTFETQLTLLPEQKSEVKTELIKGGIEQAGALVKEP